VTTAVLAMAYGSPTSLDELPAYYTDIRRGRPPSPEQLAELERRYAAIGGTSPLARRTAEQVGALAAALERLAPARFRVFFGAKHAPPRIEDALDEIAAAGIGELVGLVLAPHYSPRSVGEYLERAERRAAAHGIACTFIERWHDDPVLVELLAERVASARGELGDLEPVEVVFTAHSLPRRVLAEGDPYPAEVEETARLVARRAGLERWRVAFQSAGRTPEPWLGPDVLTVIAELARGGVRGVVVCPAGFTSDHLEVCYDLDVEARQHAEALGMAFRRTASLNDEPRLAAALARRVLAAAARLPGG